MTLGTSSCDTTVDSFFDDAFARTRHLYSSGTGSGGLPSRGLGRLCPSTISIVNTHRIQWNVNKSKRILGKKCELCSSICLYTWYAYIVSL